MSSKRLADMDMIENFDVTEVFKNSPKHTRERLLFLRRLILYTASSGKVARALEEALKWGEPSYLIKGEHH